jgi:hypothetical protein
MTEEKEKIYIKKYPKLFKEMYGPANETCLAFGLEVGDECFEVLDALFDMMESFGYWSRGGIKAADEKAKQQVPEPPKDKLYLVLEQVKEKYGTLRVYYRVQNDLTDEERAKYDPDSLTEYIRWRETQVDGAIDLADELCQKIWKNKIKVETIPPKAEEEPLPDVKPHP